jgi:hypothetical protein
MEAALRARAVGKSAARRLRTAKRSVRQSVNRKAELPIRARAWRAGA